MINVFPNNNLYVSNTIIRVRREHEDSFESLDIINLVLKHLLDENKELKELYIDQDKKINELNNKLKIHNNKNNILKSSCNIISEKNINLEVQVKEFNYQLDDFDIQLSLMNDSFSKLKL